MPEICAAAGCSAPATRVMHGGHYCASHDNARSEAPIIRCSVCNGPVPRPGARFCDSHAKWVASEGARARIA